MLAAHHGTRRVERLARLFGNSEIDVGDDFGADAARADQGREQCLDTTAVGLFEFARKFELAGRLGIYRTTITRAQQPPELVDQRDILRLQIRHAGRHQVDDRGRLVGLEAATTGELQQHRGTCTFLVAHKRGLLWQAQVHARFAHGAQARDRAP